MSKNKILIIISAIVTFIVGGVAGVYIASSWLDDSTTDDDADNQQTEQVEDNTNQTGSRVVDGVDIPQPILDHLEEDYPDYVIEDVDEGVSDDQVFYEISLKHDDSDSNSEHKLTYDAGWVLVDTGLED